MNKLLLAMGAALATAAATAANVAFTGSDGGNYSSAANWTTEGSPDEHRLPGASDTAVIPDNTTVKVVSAEDVAALVGTGKLNLNGANAKVVALDVGGGIEMGKDLAEG